MFYCFKAYDFTNSQTYELSNINKLSIKKKKGQLSNTIKKSRAESSSRRKYQPPYSTLLTSTRNTLPKNNIQRSEKEKRRLKIIDDSNTKQNQVTPG